MTKDFTQKKIDEFESFWHGLVQDATDDDGVINTEMLRKCVKREFTTLIQETTQQAYREVLEDLIEYPCDYCGVNGKLICAKCTTYLDYTHLANKLKDRL